MKPATGKRLVWGLIALFVSLVALAVAVFLLPGCSMVPTVETPSFDEIGQVGRWITANVPYVSDPLGGAWDTWQTPEETLARRAGDCEDHAILWLFLVYASFGEKGELVISSSDGVLHASARLGERTYYTIAGQVELYTMGYDDAMKLAKVKAIKEEGK